MNEIFLFPESPSHNPTSFLSKGHLVSNKEVKVKGFQLFLFVDRLDHLGFPYVVAPIKSGSGSIHCYQYIFDNFLPSFEEFGFELIQTSAGKVISLRESEFLKVSADFKAFQISNGQWNSNSEKYHQFAALHHLDIIPHISPSFFKITPAVDAYLSLFNKAYSQNLQTNFPSLFHDLCKLLDFFGYSINFPANLSPTDYFFGALQTQFVKFCSFLFSKYTFGSFCITPAAVHQIRHLYYFINSAIHNLGFEDLSSYQKSEGLPIGPCDSRTTQHIWTNILTKSSQPYILLKNLGINLHSFSTQNQSQMDLTHIDTIQCDAGGKIVSLGFSRACETLTNPAITASSLEDNLIKITSKGKEAMEPINKDTENICKKLSSMVRSAQEMRVTSKVALEKGETSMTIIKEIEEVNQELDQKIDKIHSLIDKELQKTNISLLILLILIIGVLIAWLSKPKRNKTI